MMKQEDKMSKTKLIPFDIEKAKNGAKVVTRNGLPVKIVDYPIKNEEYPILGLALIEGKEIPLLFTKTGSRGGKEESDYDLFIKEEVEEDDDYDPYKATVEYIADMVERYSDADSDLQDFYDNVKVKCREAFEYERIWIKKQSKYEYKCHQNQQDVNLPKGAVVYEDFTGGEGFYKLQLDYLNKKQVEEIEATVRAWNKEIKPTHDNIKACIGMCLTDASEQRFKDYNTNLKDCLVWLEKQGEKNTADVTPKFKVGDVMRTLEEANDDIIDGLPVVISIDDDYYRCNNETIAIKDQDEYEYPPINAKQKEVKPRRMTNQELAWWLRGRPEELREYTYSCNNKQLGTCYCSLSYDISEADTECDDRIVIRKNGGEWQEPLVEI